MSCSPPPPFPGTHQPIFVVQPQPVLVRQQVSDDEIGIRIPSFSRQDTRPNETDRFRRRQRGTRIAGPPQDARLTGAGSRSGLMAGYLKKANALMKTMQAQIIAQRFKEGSGRKSASQWRNRISAFYTN